MIVDDNCYLNGKEVVFNPEEPFIIVVGMRAIGKSVYSKSMSKCNNGIQYYSTQRYLDMEYSVRRKCIKVIEIRRL